MATVVSQDGRHRQVETGVRAVLLLVCTLLASLSSVSPRWPVTAAALAGAALLGSARLPGRRSRATQPLVESAVVGAIMVALPLEPAFLPYLLAPALAAGLRAGARAGVSAAAVSTLALMLAPSLHSYQPGWPDFATLIAPWVLIAAAASLVGAWVRRIDHARRPEDPSYVAAYRLLAQLRVVSRQLSAGLDAVSLAQTLLQQLRAMFAYSRGGLFVQSTSGEMTPLAFEGCDRVEWDLDVRHDTVVAEAWRRRAPAQRPQPLSADLPAGAHALAMPLRMGSRTFGLVVLERDDAGFDPGRLETAMEIVDESALRLETALLFGEIRSIATVEERRRLAREIHDGIAQEIASLGYLVDDLAAQVGADPRLQSSLATLRGEISRVISELRLSIFDLRSGVHATESLGTALTDFVRQAGTETAFTVHLELDEKTGRLPVHIETELLRIAQEAITNARKHSGADNLWVTCRVDPPRALLRVEDDGSGLGTGRTDSFGLEIMRERARRISADLAVTDRTGGGTLVEVVIGGPTGRPRDRGHEGATAT